MSQILDAINKAEKQRQNRIENQATREDLYQSLKSSDSPSRRPGLLSTGIIGLALCMALGYGAYHLQGEGRVKNSNSLDIPEAQTAKTAKTAQTPQPTLSNQTAANSPAVTPHLPLATNVVETNKNRSGSTPQIQQAQQAQQKKANDNNIVMLSTSKGKPHPDLAMLTPVTGPKSTKKLVELTPIPPKVKPAKKPPVAKQVSKKNKQATVRPHRPQVSRETKKNRSKQDGTHQPSAVTAPTDTPTGTAITASWKKNIHITAIVYRQAAAQRFALIRGKKVHEGELIPDSNTIVVKILPQSLIINDGSGDLMIK